MIHTLIRFAAPTEMQQVSEGRVQVNKTDWSKTHRSTSRGFCFFEPKDVPHLYYADMLERNRMSLMGRNLYICRYDDEDDLANGVFSDSYGEYFTLYPDGSGETVRIPEVCATLLYAGLFTSVEEVPLYRNSYGEVELDCSKKVRII